MTPKAPHNLLALGEGFTTEFKRSGTSNLEREYGVAEPQIEVSEHWFTVIFPRPPSSEAQEEETPGKYPSSTEQVPGKSGPCSLKRLLVTRLARNCRTLQA